VDLNQGIFRDRVILRIEDSGLNGIQFIQHQIGDGLAQSAAWTLDRLVIPILRVGGITG